MLPFDLIRSRFDLFTDFFFPICSFDDSDCQPGGGSSLMNGASPLKRKKLFDGSDDSD